MDYRKINSHIILLLIVIIVGLLIAMAVRLIALGKGLDIGTANLIFVIVLGICLVAYLAILAFLAHTIIPWVMKKLPNKHKPAFPTMLEIIPDEKEEITQQAIDFIRQASVNNYEEKQNAKISMFLEYSHLIMAPYVTDDELLRLDLSVKCFARKEELPYDLTPIKPTTLKNPDMFHFGWNMAHYFEYDKQCVVPWLQSVFAEMGKLSPSTIKGKLYDYQTQKYTIPNIDDIPKYMSER